MVHFINRTTIVYKLDIVKKNYVFDQRRNSICATKMCGMQRECLIYSVFRSFDTQSNLLMNKTIDVLARCNFQTAKTNPLTLSPLVVFLGFIVSNASRRAREREMWKTCAFCVHCLHISQPHFPFWKWIFFIKFVVAVCFLWIFHFITSISLEILTFFSLYYKWNKLSITFTQHTAHSYKCRRCFP